MKPKTRRKKLKMGNLVALARREAIYICKVIKIDKEIQGSHFDMVFIDELDLIQPR